MFFQSSNAAINDRLEEESKRPAALPFFAPGDDEQKRTAQLKTELQRISMITAITDDTRKMEEIQAHYPPAPTHVVFLNDESRAQLQGHPSCVTIKDFSREETDALAKVFKDNLPNTKIELIAVADREGNSRVAFKGISANDANALVKMQYIKRMAEAKERGETIAMIDPNTATTAEMDKALAKVEIELAQKQASLGKSPELGNTRMAELAALAKGGGAANSGHSAVIDTGKLAATVAGMQGPARMAESAPQASPLPAAASAATGMRR